MGGASRGHPTLLGWLAGRRAPSRLQGGGGKETRTAGLLRHCYLEGASPHGLSSVVASGWLVLLHVSSGILSRSPKKGIPAEAVLAHQYSRMWDTGPPLDESANSVLAERVGGPG